MTTPDLETPYLSTDAGGNPASQRTVWKPAIVIATVPLVIFGSMYAFTPTSKINASSLAGYLGFNLNSVEGANARVACENPGYYNFKSCTQSTEGICHGRVRLGFGSRWSDWKEVNGSFSCSNSFFGGDPNPGQAKECVCTGIFTTTTTTAEPTDAPTPTSTGAPTTATPQGGIQCLTACPADSVSQCPLAGGNTWNFADLAQYWPCIRTCCQDYDPSKILDGITCPQLISEFGISCTDDLFDTFKGKYFKQGTPLSNICPKTCSTCCAEGSQ